MKILIWNNVPVPYQSKIDMMLEQAKTNPTLTFDQFQGDSFGDFRSYVLSKDFSYNAVIHRNEHGILHSTPEFVRFTNEARKLGIPVLSFDFGYFEHYKNFMLDAYSDNCVSSIYKEWGQINESLDWSKIQPQIQEYRTSILKKHNFHKNNKPVHNLESGKYAVIWTQWTTDLIRHCFYEDGKPITIDKWTDLAAKKVIEAGLTPVIKLSPVKSLKPFKEIQQKYLTFLGREAHKEDLPSAIYEKEVNLKLIAHAHSHIINCSSVSNELVLTESKVTAMGRSWFDNLGIFYEPKTWDELMNYRQPEQKNINKWINWWNERQFPMEEICNKLVPFYEKYKNL